MREAGNITLGIIFERTKDQERFTDDALLYQKILSFSLSGTDHQSFTRWKMCTWLKENYPTFSNRSVDSLQPLVGRKIEKLLGLQLIHEIGTQPISTATGQTSVYAFNPTSYFLCWLIERLSANPNTVTKAHNMIFNILYLMLEMDTSSSIKIFLKLLLQKLKEKNLLVYLVQCMIELLESDIIILDISDLINQTLVLGRVTPDFVIRFNHLWIEAFTELEPHLKELFMFRLKLQYENEMKLNAQDAAQFEQSEYAARDTFDKLVLECSCLSCPHVSYEMIDLIEYTTKLRYHNIESDAGLKTNCPSCKTINSLRIIDL